MDIFKNLPDELKGEVIKNFDLMYFNAIHNICPQIATYLNHDQFCYMAQNIDCNDEGLFYYFRHKHLGKYNGLTILIFQDVSKILLIKYKPMTQIKINIDPKVLRRRQDAKGHSNNDIKRCFQNYEFTYKAWYHDKLNGTNHYRNMFYENPLEDNTIYENFYKFILVWGPFGASTQRAQKYKRYDQKESQLESIE